jgi:hypothetical protein
LKGRICCHPETVIVYTPSKRHVVIRTIDDLLPVILNEVKASPGVYGWDLAYAVQGDIYKQ